LIEEKIDGNYYLYDHSKYQADPVMFLAKDIN